MTHLRTCDRFRHGLVIAAILLSGCAEDPVAPVVGPNDPNNGAGTNGATQMPMTNRMAADPMMGNADGTTMATDGTTMAADGTTMAADGTTMAADGTTMAADGTPMMAADGTPMMAADGTPMMAADGMMDVMEDPVPGSPTFSAIYDEIIVGKGCNGGPLCHGGAVGMLPMVDPDATYEALIDVPAMGTNLADAENSDCVDTGLVRVVPGDPDASLFMQKLDPPDGVVPCGAVMPPTGSLEPAEIEQIRTWIMNGAAND